MLRFGIMVAALHSVCSEQTSDVCRAWRLLLTNCKLLDRPALELQVSDLTLKVLAMSPLIGKDVMEMTDLDTSEHPTDWQVKKHPCAFGWKIDSQVGGPVSDYRVT